MWEFRGLRVNKSASKGKTVVKPAATKLSNTWNKLSKLDKLVLYGVGLWVLIMIIMFTTATESDSIDMEYYDEVNNTDTERLA